MASFVLGQCQRARRKIGALAHKVSWGVRAVGVWATVRGAFRLAAVAVRRPDKVRVRLRSGPVMTMDRRGQLVPALVLFGDLIDPEYAFLRAVARPDWTVVDVGAAIGQFSVFAARLPCAAVQAYEPSSANIATLDRNLADNGVSARVVIHHVAVADRNGEISFTTAPNAFLSRLDRSEGAKTETVPVRTIDHEIRGDLDLLKINVAGFEPEVLAGAEQTLRAGSVSVLILLIGVRSLPWYQRLREWGYRAFFYHPKQRRLYEVNQFDVESVSRPPWPARHLIFVHERAAAMVAAALSAQTGAEGANEPRGGSLGR